MVNILQPLEDTDRRLTISMTKDTRLVARLSPTAVPRVENTPKVVKGDLPPNHQITKKTKLRRRKQAQARPTVSDSAPARNTQPRTISAAPLTSRTRTSTRARTRLSHLMRPTPSSRERLRKQNMRQPLKNISITSKYDD